MSAPFSVTMASAEIVPFAKTGGLADVVGALASSLALNGVTVSMVMPAYRHILQAGLAGEEPSSNFSAVIDGQPVSGQIYKRVLGPRLELYFIRADEYFDRPGCYGDARGDFPDNAERFAFFARGVLEAARACDSQVIHLHDWQAAPAAAFLRLQPERYPELAGAQCVVTIHNLAYQGMFGAEQYGALDLDPSYFHPGQLEFFGKINYLKAGLVNADRLTTVSPTYAREIQADGHGFGLEGVLRYRSSGLSGILNGVDYDAWNPDTDAFLAANYSSYAPNGKRTCKLALQGCYCLPAEPATPVICIVSRLADGKGLELVMEVIDAVLDEDVQFVLLGSGESRYVDYFAALAASHPGRVGVKIGFDEALAHQTIAGADILLMPSQHEPCGLTQMYALRYGTVPVVRRTGGLADSVQPYDARTGTGVGFVFEDYDSGELLATVRAALKAYRVRETWRQIVLNGMKTDNSWARSTQQYLALYRELLADRCARP